jgi:ubiquinone/menaquinone biosynthesis C-methylase UbiE
VLEVSAGTGRNVGSYPATVDSVVFTDVSYDMLRKAKLRWEEKPRQYDATFVLSDVELLTKVQHQILLNL